jgi:crotonyl-CoA carboxylase/reductase
MRQKRLQGSHFANAVQSNQMNELALAGKLDPCLSQAFTYDEIPVAHDLMYRNKHPHGNMAVLVGATRLRPGRYRPGTRCAAAPDPARGRCPHDAADRPARD